MWAKLDHQGTWRNLLIMKANRNQLRPEPEENGSTVRVVAPEGRVGVEAEFDVSLLEDSLARTPWERMQANDDALRFADSLRDAMERRNAKP
jgi:hypothetical protein